MMMMMMVVLVVMNDQMKTVILEVAINDTYTALSSALHT